MLAAVLLLTTTIETAIHAAFPVGTVGPIVTRGDLAIAHVNVVTDGGKTKSDMLLQRYPFGWQMITLGDHQVLPCELKARGASDADVAYFASAIGLRKDDPGVCSSLPRDFGPPDEVAAVRSLMNPREMTPVVRVVEDYARGTWYGWGGGETIFAKRDGVWKQIGGGGGAYGAHDLTQAYGVPPAIAEKLTAGP